MKKQIIALSLGLMSIGTFAQKNELKAVEKAIKKSEKKIPKEIPNRIHPKTRLG